MRVLRILAYAVGSVAALLVVLFIGLQTPPGQRALAGIVSNVASSPDQRIELEGLEGFFPTDLRLGRVALADGQGAWLTIDQLRLRWSFASLFTGRLRVETLSARRIEVLRTPDNPAEPQDRQPQKADAEPFRLPLGIELQSLTVDDLHLAAAVARIDSHWKLDGNALLPADLAEGRLHLVGDRTDGPSGRLAADLRFDLGRRTIDGEIVFDEGQGGVLAALLERPELERVTARLAARGDERSGTADLTLSAGDVATATGKATWQQAGQTMAISTRLEAAGPGLPPGPLADVARGPISLQADATVTGAMVRLSEARVTAGPLGLVVSGEYDRAADRLDATAVLQAAEPGPLAGLLNGISWRGLRLQAKIDLGRVRERPQGNVALDGAIDDLSLAALDPRFPSPGRMTLEARVGVQDETFTLEALDLASAPASIKGGGSYVVATATGDGHATIEVPDLSVLSSLAGRSLTGRASIDLTARSAAGDLAFGWKGTLRDFGTPDVPPELLALVELEGAATLGRDRTWSLTGARIASQGGSVTISGRGRDATGTLDLALDLPKLSTVGVELGGAATAKATIGLRDDGTDLQLAVELSDLVHRELTSRRLTLTAAASLDAAGAASGRVEASGDLNEQALSLDGRFTRDAAGGLIVPNFQGRWASAVLDVADLAVTSARTSGHARFRMTRLQDLASVTGLELAGSIEAEVTADQHSPTGRLDLRVHGADLRTAGFAVGTLDLGGTIDDPTGTAAADLTLTASRIAGVAGIGGVTATAKGDRHGVDVTLRATGVQTSANLAARVEMAGEEIRIALSRFDGRHEGIPLVLAAPTRVSIAGQRISVDPTTLRLGNGRLTVRGAIDPVASDLQLELAALPLSLLDAVAPGTGLDGTAQAKVRASGPIAAPRVDATYTVSGVRLRRPDAALLPALALQGSASLMGQQATMDARLTAGRGTNLALKGSATLPQGAAPLTATATVTGAVDIAPFAPLLGNDIRNVTGTLRPNLTLALSGTAVKGSGTVDLSNGALAMPQSGLRLDGGEGRLTLQDDVVQVQRLAFKTGSGGSVNVGGSVRLDPQDGAVLDLTVASRRALLVNRADFAATVSSDLKVTGSTSSGMDVSGSITIDRAEISIAGQQSADFPTIEVREINRPGAPGPSQTPTARKAPEPEAQGAAPIRLALTVRAPQAVFVRGRGLEAELGGEFQVTGTPAAPSVIGGLTLRRGEFNLAGRQLTFTRGVVTLDNMDAIDPQLDFVATTNVRSTSIQVAITGTPRAPKISVTSSPSLPQDEAMALLIFGRPSSSLSAFELVQVAQSLAELSGRSPGTGLLSRLRRGLGLDQLSVGSSRGSSTSGSTGSEPVSLEAGRYVAPGVYVGARQGAAGNSSRGVVQIEVLDNVKLEGDIGPNSGGRVGAKMEWDY